MIKILHILILIISILLVKPVKADFPSINPSNYDLPMACGGSSSDYFVQGFNGSSVFTWTLYFNHPNGVNRIDVTDELLSYIDLNGDRVMVSWPTEPERAGIYTFSVMEETAYGCTGEAWEQDLILNNASMFVPLDNVNNFFQVCSGSEVELKPGTRSHIWIDPELGLDEPLVTGEAGTFRVQIFDLFEQDHTDFKNTLTCSYDTIALTVRDNPMVDLGPDTVLFGAQTLLLDAYDPSFTSWEWHEFNFSQQSWGMPVSYNSDHLVEGGLGNQLIKLTVTNEYLDDIYYEPFLTCSTTDTILVEAADYRTFRIPGAFTPNGDGVNDTWIFPAPIEGGTDLYSYLDDVEVRVFNRWGILVWKSDGMFRPWDGRDLNGRPLPMDSYHYIINIKVDGRVFQYKGSVTIIR